MRADDLDGLPLVGKTARFLAARQDVDIPVNEDGTVGPGMGGTSVSPPPITNLHPLRLPREHGGNGKDPVFELETDKLPSELAYRPDPANPEGHGFLEPSRPMPFEDYERTIHATRQFWRPVR
jgi:hypothetical protein